MISHKTPDSNDDPKEEKKYKLKYIRSLEALVHSQTMMLLYIDTYGLEPTKKAGD